MRASGEVAAVPLSGGGFGACQVVGESSVCALDWRSDARPTLPELAGAGPLTLDHHMNQGEVACIAVFDDPPPPGWVWLGSLPPVAEAETQSFSGWAWVPFEIAAQRRWDRQLSDEVKQAYRQAATRGPIDVDLGDGPVTVDARPASGAPVDAGPAEAALRAFVGEFNHLAAGIDTIRRDEAGDAFLGLAARAGIPAEQADEWFDEWRDF